MKLFQRKEMPKRTLDDILTAKEEKMQETELCVENCEENVAEKTKSEDVSPKIEKELKDTALSCFGWEEVKTERWLVKSAKIWYALMSFLWFLLGGVTFAPIIFIANKINVIFKNRRKSIFISIAIYAILVTLIVLLIMSKRETAS